MRSAHWPADCDNSGVKFFVSLDQRPGTMEAWYGGICVGAITDRAEYVEAAMKVANDLIRGMGAPDPQTGR